MVSWHDAAPVIPNDEVRYWLNQIDYHAYNQAWLNARADRITKVMWAALNRDEFTVKATDALIKVAPHMMTHHRVDEWVNLLLAALGRALDLHDDELQGRLYTVMGHGRTLQGKIRPAQAAFNNALNQAKAYISDPLVAEEIKLMVYIGLLRTETYQYTAEFTPEHVAEVLELARQIKDPMLTANLYQALASTYAHRGELEQSLGYGLTALGYWMQRGRPLEIAKTALIVAMAYSRQMLLPQAEQMAEFAYAYLQRTENKQYAAIINQLRGTIAAQQERWQQAEICLESARAEFRVMGWRQHEATVERSLALMYIPQKRYERARTRLDHAAQVWDEFENYYEQAAFLATQGYLEAEQGQLKAASLYYQSALAVCEQIPEMSARDQLIASIHADIEHYGLGVRAQRNDPV